MLIFAYFGAAVESDSFIRLCKCEYDRLCTPCGGTAFDEDDAIVFISSALQLKQNDRLTPVQVCKRENETILREGKPRFVCEDVHFNLSHTEGLTICAFSSRDVGVDAEKLRPRDFSRFAFLGGDGSLSSCYKEWTRREAVLKLTGEGVGGIRSFYEREGVITREIWLSDEYVVQVAEYADTSEDAL